LSQEKIEIINKAIGETNTTKTRLQFTNKTHDLLKLAVLTAAGLGVYAYFTKK
jgi:hypothetical protein